MAQRHKVLYIAYPCPFAHRTSIVHTLKGLEDIIPMVVLYYELFPHGWSFTGRANTAEKDPLYGFTKLSQLYHLANPDYDGRFSVPVLWDKTHKTIVSNESADIIRMLYSSFDSFLPSELREANKATGGLLPSNLISEIDEMDDWIFRLLNVGVYKAGFATEQAVYEENCLLVFEGLDRVESVLKSSKGLYLLGDCITEPDIRLFPTIVRFDVAYHTLFKCNLKMIRYQYPKIEGWMRGLYYGEGNVGKAFGGTTCFEHVRQYLDSSRIIVWLAIGRRESLTKFM